MESVASKERGTVNAITNLVRNTMYGLGGKIGGMLLAQQSFTLPILTASGVYALAVWS